MFVAEDYVGWDLVNGWELVCKECVSCKIGGHVQ